VEHYHGLETKELDMEFVGSCIDVLENSKERTAGYGIDFGILEDGSTSLIEWNDGFALGAYDLDGEKYTHLLLSRWQELMNQK